MVAWGSRSLCTAACSPFLMLPVKVDGEKRERERGREETERSTARLGRECRTEKRRNRDGQRDGRKERERERGRERERAGVRNREGKEGGRNRRCTGGDRCTSSVLRDSWRAINRVFRGFGKPAPTLPQTWPPATPLCFRRYVFLLAREEQRNICYNSKKREEIIVSSNLYL